MEFTIYTMTAGKKHYYHVVVYNAAYQPRKHIIAQNFNTKKEVFNFIATYIGRG